MTEDEMYEIIRGYEESERDYHERNIELENENAKLRKLIADVHEALRADKAGMFHRLILASMEEEMRMHELGIEVKDEQS